MYKRFMQYQAEDIVSFVPFQNQFFNSTAEEKAEGKIFDTCYYAEKILNRGGTQKIEPEEAINYNKYLYIHYAGSGKILDTIQFLITDDTLIVGNRKYKIVDKGCLYDYMFKVLKTQINVNDTENFKKHLVKAMDTNSVWHHDCFHFLKQLKEK